jgi:hypothetical protein
MDDLIRNTLSTMRQTGSLLSNKKLLFETNWRLFDKSNKITYFNFKPDGTLICTINGDYERGEWDIINHKSILFKEGSNKAHFKSLLFEKALVILDKTTINDELFILYDEEIINDYDFVSYLEEIKMEQEKKEQVVSFQFQVILYGLMIFIVLLLLAASNF